MNALGSATILFVFWFFYSLFLIIWMRNIEGALGNIMHSLFPFLTSLEDFFGLVFQMLFLWLE